jgi:16S rRNA (cytidine1402-2'-O)-methyltransferase
LRAKETGKAERDRGGGQGTLYLVATPIGNLEDITLRALRVLGHVGLIACEDTRHTRKLLSHFEIKARLISYYDANERLRAAELVGRLQAGEDIALVSDAGTPGISDPGYDLVKAAAEAGIRVVPIPGPSAAITALSASGLPTDRFLFAGFLPAKRAAREKVLRELAPERSTLVLYESGRRLADTLSHMAEVLGPRLATVARELTKLNEEFIRGSLTDLAEGISSEPVKAKGEATIVVQGGSSGERKAGVSEVSDMLRTAIDAGLSVKEAVRDVASETGMPRREVYRLALALKKEEGP